MAAICLLPRVPVMSGLSFTDASWTLTGPAPGHSHHPFPSLPSFLEELKWWEVACSSALLQGSGRSQITPSQLPPLTPEVGVLSSLGPCSLVLCMSFLWRLRAQTLKASGINQCFFPSHKASYTTHVQCCSQLLTVNGKWGGKSQAIGLAKSKHFHTSLH